MAESEAMLSAETPEVAEPVSNDEATVDVEESTTTNEVGSEEKVEVAEPSFDRNAIAAAARREAEAKLKAQDAEFVRRFGNFKNPATGKNISSMQEYLDALDAQETMQRNRELQEKGIDPSIIEKAIANNPTVRQAEMVLEQSRQQQAQISIENEIKAISALDPSIKSFNDLENSDNKDLMLDLVQKGYSLADAFKVANFDRLMGKKTAAAEQKAINQAKGKSHLTPTNSGTNANDGLDDIPARDVEKWKAFFPDASMKELREKYNKAKR